MEKITDKQMKSFLETAKAFKKIRDGKLFRGEFDSFEDYCQAKYQINADDINKYIELADTMDSFSN